jgi:hypothetical protein
MSEHPNDFVVGHRQFADIESLLKRALSPVEPPKELEARLEGTLGSLVDLAAEELEAWELRAMRDPRNWVRPVAAAAVGSTAAVGLVLVRTQRRRHKRRGEADNPVDLVGRTLRDLAREARRAADDLF